MHMMIIGAWCGAAFLAGSFPSSYILTHLFKGVDIREHGSGNPGATNVYRVAGLVPALLTFVLDAAKGYVPVLLALSYFWEQHQALPVLVGICAIAGHVWSVFLRFRGGKGVATACGVFMALLPVPTLYALFAFGLVLAMTRYVSLGSIIAAIILSLSAWARHEEPLIAAIASSIAVMIIIRHKANISRLLAGQEHKLGKPKPESTGKDQ